MAHGILYGVGVGPGDPDLMTVKAIRVMNGADVVIATGNERMAGSQALEIARPHLKADASVVVLTFPHTFESIDERAPHRDAAARVLKELEGGRSAAFLTLGDPMTYSTFSYVMEAALELDPTLKVEVIPGVTSFAAAAAASLTPLAEGDETLSIVGASRTPASLLAALDHSHRLVVMKPYRNAAKVIDIAEERGLCDGLVYCTEVSRPGQTISRGAGPARAALGRYMSLFLLKNTPKAG